MKRYKLIVVLTILSLSPLFGSVPLFGADKEQPKNKRQPLNFESAEEEQTENKRQPLSSESVEEEQQGGKKQSFKVDKGGNLDVSVNTGSIRIITWDKDEVLVNPRGIYDEDLDNVKATQSGNTIHVTYTEGWGGSADEVVFEISVPAQFNVNIRTSSGDLEVRGMLKGELKGSTSGGDIRLGNIGGKVDVNTSGGDISAGNIDAGISLSTSGGDIRLGNINGEAEIKTMGGDISIQDVGKRLNAKTYGGDIKIGNIGGDADVSTYGGSIIAKNISGNAKISTSGGDINLGGASGTVKAKTLGGDLMLHKVSGSIDATTNSGDVSVELTPVGNGRSRISSSNGMITLLVPENAKATIDARIRVRGNWSEGEEENQIRSDFKPQTYNKSEDGRSIKANYILNGGGQNIVLETTNSDIVIKKALK